MTWPVWSPVVFAAIAVAVAPDAARPTVISYPGFSVQELCARIDRQITALGGIVMHEEISRYDSARGGTGKVDEFDALVEMADGADSFTGLRRNGRPCPKAAQIRGAWSFGEFSTLLRVSRDALDNQDVRLVTAPGGEPETLIAAFHYAASDARWFVAVGPRIYWLDFQGEIRVSATTGDVLSIAWISAPPSPESGIGRVQRSVTFARTEVAGEIRNLPQSAEYRVVHTGGRVEWNTARFSDPARYGALVSVRFGE